MLSRLLDNRQLEQTAKKEFVFAASTVFIVMFVIFLVQFGDTVIVQVAKQIYWEAISFCPDPTSKICQNLAKVDHVEIKAQTLIDLMLLYMEAPAVCTQRFLDFLGVLSDLGGKRIVCGGTPLSKGVR